MVLATRSPFFVLDFCFFFCFILGVFPGLGGVSVMREGLSHTSEKAA